MISAVNLSPYVWLIVGLDLAMELNNSALVNRLRVWDIEEQVKYLLEEL